MAQKKLLKKPGGSFNKNTPSEGEVSSKKPLYTDLRQVMDYTRPFTVFFSGVEYELYFDNLYEIGIRNFLMSYEYAKGKGAGKLKRYPDVHLFIDSGAFTYMSDPKYEEYTQAQWEKQIEEYLDWGRKHKDQIFAMADLDLQYLPNVGYEMVYEWRKKYFEPFMLETGVPVCFIYHEDGIDVWEYMCKRYPYIGISLAVGNSSEAFLKEAFRVAEKHNTLVQGMASTKVGHLMNYPFYTVDSTTWKAGLRYGKTVVFNNDRMHEFDKQQLQEKGIPILSRYDMQFDIEKLLADDVAETCKCSAYSFVLMEKYINERAASRMYWLKQRAQKVKLDDLPADFFPTPGELDEGVDDFKEYAQKMNINPDYDGARNLVIDMTVFLNWFVRAYVPFHEVYLENEGKALNELHDVFVNRIVSTEGEKVSDLRAFFTRCLEGEDDKLLQLGTNFDRVIQERDSYVDDNEVELVDISPEEVRARVHSLLPSPDGETGDMPEVDALDEKIYNAANIVPVFGEDGKFIKGQVYRPVAKQVYSQKFPKFACDTCHAATKCPEYKAGFVCAYDKVFKKFDCRDAGDVVQAMQGMVNHNMTRMQKLMVEETLMGIHDQRVTGLLDQNLRMMERMSALYTQMNTEVFKRTSTLRADGTREDTMQVVSNPQSGGIMEKLIGSVLGARSSNSAEDSDFSTTSKKGEVYEKIEPDLG